jgi:hypothetical protein
MNKLKHKYRLVFFNDNTFEEVWHLRLSLFNVLATVGAISFFLIFLVIFLMAFTPLREFIPGYPNEDMRRSIVISKLRLDSLEKKLQLNDQYFANLNALISGQDPIKFDSIQKTDMNYKNLKFAKSERDSLSDNATKKKNSLMWRWAEKQNRKAVSQRCIFSRP